MSRHIEKLAVKTVFLTLLTLQFLNLMFILFANFYQELFNKYGIITQLLIIENKCELKFLKESQQRKKLFEFNNSFSVYINP